MNSSKDSKSYEVSITQRLNRGTLWAAGTFIASQVLRLGSNLILTRLLFPEAFGLMALVNMFIQGLVMLSDVGINVSIIRSKHGDKPRYLNTAFSLQVIRGIILCLLAIVLSVPVSWFYNQPDLMLLMVATALTPLVAGFLPTKYHKLTRKVNLSLVAMIDLTGQFLAVTIMCVIAYFWRSVWALVVGAILGKLLQVFLAYLLIPGNRDQFHIDRHSALEIIHFGKWVFLSTALYFLASWADRLVLGNLMTMEELGVYSIAFFIANAVNGAVASVGSKVLLPLYSEMARKQMSLGKPIRKMRTKILLFALPPICCLVGYGDVIVQLLYDERYLEAGWMLRILAAGSLITALTVTISPVLNANGDSRRALIMMVGLIFMTAGGIAIGWMLMGTVGIIFGFAAARYAYYPIVAFLVNRYRVWDPQLDFAAIFGTGVLTGLLCLFRPVIIPFIMNVRY